MTIIHYRDWRGNFGDDLNPIFFQETVPSYVRGMAQKKLYGIGTLLNSATKRIENAVVLGSGYGYGENVNWDPGTVEILGVRGPLTAKAMGKEDVPGMVIGDPALLVPELPSLLSGRALASGGLIVAPHHRSSEAWDLDVATSSEFCVLDPGLVSVHDYIATIREASLVVTESLHGAIIAAAFGVPFIPVAMCSRIDSTKWTDFFMLLGETVPRHIEVSIPKSIFARRLQVAYARRLGNIDQRRNHFLGRALRPQDLERFRSDVLRIARLTKPVLANPAVIDKCKGAIAAACEKLERMLQNG